VQARSDKIAKARRLLAVDLWEISLVTFPMLAGARVSKQKSAKWAVADQHFNKRPIMQQHGVKDT
jgi:phage head maturation protease